MWKSILDIASGLFNKVPELIKYWFQRKDKQESTSNEVDAVDRHEKTQDKIRDTYHRERARIRMQNNPKRPTKAKLTPPLK